jgi:molecular chaperone DnaK (HSP70)
MADIFGLDFGTTNSLASRVILQAGSPVLRDYVDVEGDPHPSVVAYVGDRVIAGREAYDLLDRDSAGGGDAMRSPKSHLGSGASFLLGGIARRPRELAAAIIKHVVDHARGAEPTVSFDQAIVTIPVDMDGRGRRELREAARDVGVQVHQLVHEPLAALYAYLRADDELERRIATLGESPILVVDWGGGTLDLTLARIVGRTLVQFGSRGEHRVGGDRFDELLRNLVRRRHAEKHELRTLEPLQDGAAPRLLTKCELAKKRLSDEDDALIYMANYLAVDGAAANVEVDLTKADLDGLAAPLVQHAMEGITALLADARIDDAHLGLVLLTGGMSRMPLIGHSLQRRFGLERVPAVPAADRLISRGAAWIAHDQRRLQLAKAFELTLADDHPAELLPAGTDLPVDEDTHPERFPVYCVDPRDGRARVLLTRPVDPGRAQPLDPRRMYGTLQLPVDQELGPLQERLDLDIVVDSDLVVTVTARSQLSGAMATREIHELEFGLGLGPQ